MHVPLTDLTNISYCVSQPASGALYKEDDFVIMTTMEKEKYKCLLPSLTGGDEVSNSEDLCYE